MDTSSTNNANESSTNCYKNRLHLKPYSVRLWKPAWFGSHNCWKKWTDQSALTKRIIKQCITQKYWSWYLDTLTMHVEPRIFKGRSPSAEINGKRLLTAMLQELHWSTLNSRRDNSTVTMLFKARQVLVKIPEQYLPIPAPTPQERPCPSDDDTPSILECIPALLRAQSRTPLELSPRNSRRGRPPHLVVEVPWRNTLSCQVQLRCRSRDLSLALASLQGICSINYKYKPSSIRSHVRKTHVFLTS